MHNTGIRPLIRTTLAALALGLLIGVPATTIANEPEETAHKAYVDEIVLVLRANVTAMRMILDHDTMKYADNMARHAEALERTFGMIGPMDWHASQAFEHMAKGDAAEKLTEEQFEELAEKSHRAMVRVGRAAHRYERDKDKDRMRTAINNVMKSCGACHSKLPEGTVPHVWKGMKE